MPGPDSAHEALTPCLAKVHYPSTSDVLDPDDLEALATTGLSDNLTASGLEGLKSRSGAQSAPKDDNPLRMAETMLDC